MNSFELPPDLMLGSATASLQIEGGDTNNSWHRWVERGHIKDKSHCIIADDHWNRYREDISLMRKMHHNVYRMSLEWSRIEPEEGTFNADAIKRYRAEIEELIRSNITPIVTLHHFSNPLWFEDSGGWLNKNAPSIFERYAQYAAYHLGDLVKNWVTINEPNVYLFFGYAEGIWPPGHNNIKEYFVGAKNMIHAHILAYHKIHEIREMAGHRETMVGAAHHIRIYDPKNKTPLDKWACNNVERFFQDIFITGMATGKTIFPIGTGNYPFGRGYYQDFFGINYYTRDLVKYTPNPARVFAELHTNPDSEKNDLGWEIYPEGLYRACRKYFERFNIPIYITENGTCDAEDRFRARYIYDHLYQVKRLLDDGIDIRCYCHWSTLDNFEWLEGLSARFGLVYVDYENRQKRKLRKSGEFYGEICKHKAVTERMIKKYLHA
jgi:beta-glucosidase